MPRGGGGGGGTGGGTSGAISPAISLIPAPLIAHARVPRLPSSLCHPSLLTAQAAALLVARFCQKRGGSGGSDAAARTVHHKALIRCLLFRALPQQARRLNKRRRLRPSDASERGPLHARGGSSPRCLWHGRHDDLLQNFNTAAGIGGKLINTTSSDELQARNRAQLWHDRP